MMMRGDERQSHVMMMSIRERKAGYLVRERWVLLKRPRSDIDGVGEGK